MSGAAQLEKIVEVHAAMVRRIATVYERHPDRVDDLVQDVWIAVWQALPRLNNPASLKGYIARITQNLCVTHIRRALVRQAQPLSDNLQDPAPASDEAAAQTARLAAWWLATARWVCQKLVRQAQIPGYEPDRRQIRRVPRSVRWRNVAS